MRWNWQSLLSRRNEVDLQRWHASVQERRTSASSANFSADPSEMRPVGSNRPNGDDLVAGCAEEALHRGATPLSSMVPAICQARPELLGAMSEHGAGHPLGEGMAFEIIDRHWQW